MISLPIVQYLGISFIFVTINAASDVFCYTSVCSLCPPFALFTQPSTANNAIYQTKLDILGMVIYSTEFVLWCGVFAYGGYFSLKPWLR
jgi:hypothetical protein